MKKRENWYRRDPGAFLAGTARMSLEERGVYNTVVDLLYLTWRPIEDSPAYIAGHCGCAVQKLNPILRRLIESGKLIRFEEGDQTFISNPAFERERAEVKGEPATRSGRAKVDKKSGEVDKKSDGVEKNPPVCEEKTSEKQTHEKPERNRQSEIDTPSSLRSDTPEESSSPPSLPGTALAVVKTHVEQITAKGTRLSPDWAPTEAHMAYALEHGFTARPAMKIAEDFRDYWIAQPGAKGRKSDWLATWRTWIRRQVERGGRNGSGNRNHRQDQNSRDSDAAIDELFGTRRDEYDAQ